MRYETDLVAFLRVRHAVEASSISTDPDALASLDLRRQHPPQLACVPEPGEPTGWSLGLHPFFLSLFNLGWWLLGTRNQYMWSNCKPKLQKYSTAAESTGSGNRRPKFAFWFCHLLTDREQVFWPSSTSFFSPVDEDSDGADHCNWCEVTWVTAVVERTACSCPFSPPGSRPLQQFILSATHTPCVVAPLLRHPPGLTLFLFSHLHQNSSWKELCICSLVHSRPMFTSVIPMELFIKITLGLLFVYRSVLKVLWDTTFLEQLTHSWHPILKHSSFWVLSCSVGHSFSVSLTDTYFLTGVPQESVSGTLLFFHTP